MTHQPTAGRMPMTQVAALLDATPALLQAQLATLDDALLHFRPAPEEWSIKQIIGHLIEADKQAFRDRIRTMIQQDEPTLSGMDAAAHARTLAAEERTLQQLLDELRELRDEIVLMVENLDEDALARTGQSPRLGTLQVADFVYEWPFHDASHVAQIQENLRAAILPNMGPVMQRAVGGS